MALHITRAMAIREDVLRELNHVRYELSTTVDPNEIWELQVEASELQTVIDEIDTRAILGDFRS